MVDGNADGASNFAVNAGFLQFLESEATASTELHVVAQGGAANGRAQKTIDGSRGNAGSLLNACNSSGLFTAGLIEPGLYAALPLLTKVLVGQLVVVLQHHCLSIDPIGIEKC